MSKAFKCDVCEVLTEGNSVLRSPELKGIEYNLVLSVDVWKAGVSVPDICRMCFISLIREGLEALYMELTWQAVIEEGAAGRVDVVDSKLNEILQPKKWSEEVQPWPLA